MISQLQLSFDKAKELRDEGMRASTANAEAKVPTWSERALAFFHEYATTHLFLTTEDVRIYAHNVRGFPAAPDSRAWGSIARAAAHRKWTRKSDRTKIAINPKVHQQELRVWESLICSS